MGANRREWDQRLLRQCRLPGSNDLKKKVICHALLVPSEEEHVSEGLQSLCLQELVDLCHQNVTECQQESKVSPCLRQLRQLPSEHLDT